jgi:hypothetical protein
VTARIIPHRYRRVDEYLLPLPTSYESMVRLTRRIQHDHPDTPRRRIKVDLDTTDDLELIIRVPVDWEEEDAYRARQRAVEESAS